MQYQGVLDQLRQAVDAVEEAGEVDVDVDALGCLVRRLAFLHRRLLSSLDDVSAARCLGTSVRDVRSSRAASRRVASVPEVATAVASGALSLGQGEVLASHPEVASELLSLAPGKTTPELKSEASKLVESSASNEAERHERLRSLRSFSRWVDGEGLVNILAKVPPESAARVLAKVRARENTLVREPGASGAAHRADAFCDLVASSGEVGSKTKTVVNVHVDLESLKQGWVKKDGFCEVAGLGSIPVARARSLFEEAVIHVLVRAKNKLVWAGGGKELPKRIKEAVIAFNRHCCVLCGEPAEDLDHVTARVNGGDHDLENLQPLCGACHGDKTVKDAPWSARYYRDRQPRAG